MTRRRILVIGHAIIPTGFSRVLHSLLDHLSEWYEVHHFAYMLTGLVPPCRWTIHTNPTPIDVYGSRHLSVLMETVKPHIVLLMQDPWLIPIHLKLLRPYRAQTTIVAYCPVDGSFRNPASVAWISQVSALVLYTQFARHAIEACVESFRAVEPGYVVPPISVIPHGTSVDRFYPYPNGDITVPAQERRKQARRALFADGRVPDDAFIVLNASRNQSRKRIDLSIEGFARFARDKPPNVYLYLHMGMKGTGWNIQSLALRAGIADRLLTTAAGDEHPTVASEHLNLIYNACDIGINTASGEGWGLVAFEHAATGAAQVLPCHTAYQELWDGSAVLIEPSHPEPMNLYLEGSVASPIGIASALESLYQDATYRHTMAMRAYDNARQPAYQWHNIAEKWRQLFDALLA